MSKINPIYFVILLLAVLVFGYMKKEQLHTQLQQNYASKEDALVFAKGIEHSKQSWSDASKKIDSIIKNSAFKSVKFSKQDNKGLILLEAKEIDQGVLKNLTNKLLNSYLSIKSFQISLDEKTATMRVEVEK